MPTGKSNSAPLFHIGSIPVTSDVILAPMDGISDHPFRLLCRRIGSAVTYTEFINVLDVPARLNNLDRRIFFQEEERPIGFQLYGSQPQDFLTAARALLPDQPDFFDLNLGCSVRRVAGRGAGAGLLTQPQTIAEIAGLLVKEIPIPITAKIRLGWDEEHRNYLEVAHILEDNGIAALAVHGRTRRASWRDPSQWEAIAEIKQKVTIPVLGNGDVQTPADIDRMKKETGCDAVMIGRAALGNPWLFSRIDKNSLPALEIVQTIQTHWDSMSAFYGPEKASYGFRKHMKAYLSCPQFAGLDIKAIITSSQPMQTLHSLLDG
jgi:nifR3 family TIM-barrel protein